MHPLYQVPYPLIVCGIALYVSVNPLINNVVPLYDPAYSHRTSRPLYQVADPLIVGNKALYVDVDPLNVNLYSLILRSKALYLNTKPLKDNVVPLYEPAYSHRTSRPLYQVADPLIVGDKELYVDADPPNVNLYPLILRSKALYLNMKSLYEPAYSLRAARPLYQVRDPLIIGNKALYVEVDPLNVNLYPLILRSNALYLNTKPLNDKAVRLYEPAYSLRAARPLYQVADPLIVGNKALYVDVDPLNVNLYPLIL
ncbi:hypothetical protein CSV74_11895 [Sporosarcina sp. P19]|nr:hypothetical protein CSV74_11895 [Sporosarcina sp. P19]